MILNLFSHFDRHCIIPIYLSECAEEVLMRTSEAVPPIIY